MLNPLSDTIWQMIFQIKTTNLFNLGINDKVTPPHVAEEFHKLLPNSELNWIKKCGHAAMWEHPKPFSEIVLKWLKDHNI